MSFSSPFFYLKSTWCVKPVKSLFAPGDFWQPTSVWAFHYRNLRQKDKKKARKKLINDETMMLMSNFKKRILESCN